MEPKQTREWRVWLITLIMTLAFGLYETLKTLLFPHMMVITSHALSTGVVGVLTFVTARYILRRYQRLSAATERMNHLLQAVLGAMREGVLILNPDGTVAMHNPALLEIFKWPERAPAPRRLMDVTDDPTIHEAFRAAYNQGLSREHQVQWATPEKRSFLLHVTPLMAEPGRPALGAVGVFFDITKLEKLEQVRREFFANLSHELRTPLTAVLAYVETLLDGAISDPDHYVPFLKIVQKHALRMQALARDISDLSAVESGEIRLEPAALTLKGVVDNLCALAGERARAARVSLSVNIPADLSVLADPHRLEQILSNLIDNAIKFNRKGGAIRITAYPEEAAVVIAIHDTGIGISPADHGRIFERFYRVDKSRSREIGGSGLGLAIVKHLVQLHGGEINVESTPNRGSTFTLKLPAPPEHEQSP